MLLRTCILFIPVFLLLACKQDEVVPQQDPDPDPDPEPQMEICPNAHETLSGTYIFYDDADTSTDKITFFATPEGFTTTGLSGYGFWFPGASLSGHLDSCDIVLNEYVNVQVEGLPSPGGIPRYYYATMTGHGRYFPERDSIVISLYYLRTGAFALEYNDDIYFKKLY
jgi:hypothetical protein